MKTDSIATGLGEFFKSLLPSLSKRDMVWDLTHTYEELQQIVIPMYDMNIDGDFRGHIATEMDKRLKKSKLDFSKNSYKTIGKLLKKIDENEEDVVKMMEHEFAREVIKDALDYKKINIIYYVEALNFVNDYARRFISAVISQEYESELAHKIIGPVDKATVAWVADDRNMDSFIRVLEILTPAVKSFLDKLKDLEGHIFDPIEWESIKSVSGSKMDPVEFGFVPVRMNLIYHVGMAINGWRVAKYERNKEELARVQLMVIALEEQRAKTQDKEKLDNLTQQIRYYGNRINVLSAKIEDMEDRR
jgi:hypothetical protein